VRTYVRTYVCMHDTVGYHSRCTVVLFLSQLLTKWAWPDWLYTLTV